MEISEYDILGSINSQTDKTEYGGIYDSATLFEGDFTKTAEYCKSLRDKVQKNGTPSYGVLDNNCMQVAARAMKESYSANQPEYWLFRQIVAFAIPTVVDFVVNLFGKKTIKGPSGKKSLIM